MQQGRAVAMVLTTLGWGRTAVANYALFHKMKDYEVVQQALDLFLSRDESVS